MCGTQHPVGTAVCTTCRASGVAHLRLMLECPTCRHLDITPRCERCRAVAPLKLDDLIMAEEISDAPTAPVGTEFDVTLDFGRAPDEETDVALFDDEDEAAIIDLIDVDPDEDDSDVKRGKDRS
jgi:hypothetical protein